MKPYSKLQASNFMICDCLWLEYKIDSYCDVIILVVKEYDWYTDDIWTLHGLHMMGKGAFWPDVTLFSQDYNKTWRVWPARPSVEESRCVPWG